MNITFTIYKLKCLTELTIMKKILFSLTVALGLFGSVNAQFPDGTLCPDFTGTDINGNTHNLYTYLYFLIHEIYYQPYTLQQL